MINTEKLLDAQSRAAERAIKIHDALDIPYIGEKDGMVVEMSHGQVLRVIDKDPWNKQKFHEFPSRDTG